MSICDTCIHDDVCGLEDNHEEAVTFCADMISKDIFDKIKAELIQSIQNGTLKIENGNKELFRIIDKYKEESEDKEVEI